MVGFLELPLHGGFGNRPGSPELVNSKPRTGESGSDGSRGR